MTSKPGAIVLPDDEHVAWVPDERERIRPFSTGGNYFTFQLAEEGSDRTAAYGKNYRPLAEFKRTYDPDNPFRANRNICLA